MAAGVGGASAALGAPPTGPGGALVLQFRLDDRTAAMSHRRVLSAACAVGLVLPGASPPVLLPTKMAAGALCYGAALLPFARRRLGSLAVRPI